MASGQTGVMIVSAITAADESHDSVDPSTPTPTQAVLLKLSGSKVKTKASLKDVKIREGLVRRREGLA